MKLFVCICIVLVHASAIYGNVLPDAVTKLLCSHSDPNVNDCLLKNAGKILTFLADGVPASSLPPVDPLFLEFMTAEGNLENIKISGYLKNITLYGISTAEFKRVKIDSDGLLWEVAFRIPHLRMVNDYLASGRFFVFSVESTGLFEGDFDNADITLNIRLKEVKHKGVKYYTVDKITENIYVEKTRVKFTSANPAEQPAVSVIQNFFNENERLVMDTINPLVNIYGAEYFKHVMNRFLMKVPAEELSPNLTQLLSYYNPSDPNIEKCLLNNAGKILSLIANGVPTSGIDPIDPLYLDFVEGEGNLANVRVNGQMKNITLYGISTANFKKIRFHSDTLVWEKTFRIPVLRMKTEYSATGHLFGLPLGNNAKFDGTFDNADITLNFHLKEVERNGVKYYTVDSITENIYVEKTKVKLTAINAIVQLIVTIFQTFCNVNDQMVMNAINPLVNIYGAEYFKAVINRFLSVVPAKEFLSNTSCSCSN